MGLVSVMSVMSMMSMMSMMVAATERHSVSMVEMPTSTSTPKVSRDVWSIALEVHWRLTLRHLLAGLRVS